MSGNDSRADRLRRRRRQQRDQQAEQANPSKSSDSSDPSDLSELSEPSESSEPSEPSEPSETDKPGDRTSVKEDRIGTYMYLPQDLRTDLNFQYKELSLAYERAFGGELEKNRHFYPLVVRAGLERLSELDEEAVRERVADVDE